MQVLDLIEVIQWPMGHFHIDRRVLDDLHVSDGVGLDGIAYDT